MGFTSGTSGSSSIGTSSDAALNNPSNGQVLAYNASAAKWQNLSIPTVPIRFSAQTPTVGASGSDYTYTTRTLTGARMRVGTPPNGSSLSVTIEQSVNNGSSWTTVGTLTIASGTSTEAVASFSQAQSVGTLLRLNVSSVGASSAATGAVVDVLWQ